MPRHTIKLSRIIAIIWCVATIIFAEGKCRVNSEGWKKGGHPEELKMHKFATCREACRSSSRANIARKLALDALNYMTNSGYMTK